MSQAVTLAQGVHSDVPMHVYLADPCIEPSLSSTIVNTLYRQTPQRAHMIHPRFGGSRFDSGPRADIGSAVHSLLHGGYPVVPVVQVSKRSGKEAGVLFEPQDWKTDDAQEQRDAIRKANGIPVLPRDMPALQSAADSAQRVLEVLGGGLHEQTLIWYHDGVWYRGRADWASNGAVSAFGIDAPGGLDLDTKTVELADEIAWLRTNADELDVQLALRWVGWRALGRDMTMGWLLQEIEPPYDNCVVIATPELINAGVRKIKHAHGLFKTCLRSGIWPGKPRKAMRANVSSKTLWELESRGIE